jgi:hypothetical protein
VQLLKLEVLVDVYVEDDTDSDDYGCLEIPWVVTGPGLHSQ